MIHPNAKRAVSVLYFFCFAIAASVVAASTNFSSVDLDLDDPTTGNNVFSTLFRITDPITSQPIEGGPVSVNYEDPDMTGMQVNLDVDFSDVNAPIVNTIEFVGEPGDINHVFTGGPIDVMFDNGLFAIDVDVTPNDIKGFLRTQGGPISVNNDGSFESGNTNLVARQGTVNVLGTITSALGAAPVDETFNLADTSLDQFNDSISAGAVNNVAVVPAGIDGGDRVYDVIMETVLTNTELPFNANGFELILDITGTFRGVGEIRIPVPEPASLGLLAFALGLAATTCRR